MTSHEGHDSNQLSPSNTQDTPRKLSRSPHPYYRRSFALTKQYNNKGAEQALDHESSESSTERGTEADDEKGPILRGLPPPPLKARKGLRGSKTPLDSTPAISPFPTPPATEEQGHSYFWVKTRTKNYKKNLQDQTRNPEFYAKYVRRRQAEIVRRSTETVLLFLIGWVTCANSSRTEYLHRTQIETLNFILILGCLCALYPLRHALRAFRYGYHIPKALRMGLHVPSRFDLGPLLYPVFIPALIAVSLFDSSPGLLVVNLVLGLSSLPEQIMPFRNAQLSGTLHWAISLVPLAGPLLHLHVYDHDRLASLRPSSLYHRDASTEILALLFPLHQNLCTTLKYLTTTSLDPAELHLLSVGLINVLLFAASPQTEILKTIMWLGGLSLFVVCRQALSWEVALARIPAWKFARNKPPRSGVLSKVETVLVALLPHHRYRQSKPLDSDHEEPEKVRTVRKKVKSDIILKNNYVSIPTIDLEPDSGSPPVSPVLSFSNGHIHSINTASDRPDGIALTERRKPSSSSARSGLLALTFTQAQVLKWLLAGYVYIAVTAIVLVGLRYRIGEQALHSQEPFGWALGYLFGNVPQVRFWVVTNNLEKWIKLPQHTAQFQHVESIGWFELLRQSRWGPANVRLAIACYCVLVLGVGIGVVLQLRSKVEVDTRRKVFHGIMVAMLLPTVAIDPCFISLALAIILAIFLLLDLFRASQLPPISKPLTTFLAPYVDGRDYRGPVIVSHIFLLIGCAIPLWLSLAGVDRSGGDPWIGWETSTRDVSMISGVVCVGMGDAAASLIGRRYGKTKWFWGGGKSLEGSFAFALAVTIGIMASWLWLRLGGWIEWNVSMLPMALLKSMLAASGASLLESVLTAANDNVVVPIGLWLLVRGLQI